MHAFRAVLAWAVLAGLASCGGSPESADARLSAVVSRYADAAQRLDAFYAPYYGIEEDLDAFGDYLSPAYLDRARKLHREALEAIDAIDPSRLSDDARVEYQLFRDDMAVALRTYGLPLERLAFHQMGNRLIDFIDESSPALSYFPFDSVEHYRAWLRRAAEFPAYVERQIATLQQGIDTGLVLNCTVARNTARTWQDALEPDVAKNPFLRPLAVMPETFTPAEREELTAGFREVVAESIIPAFARLDGWFTGEYLTRCRESYGIGAVPGGAGIYAHLIRVNTDLDWTADRIHALGLEEVGRITGEMAAVMAEVGFEGSLAAFRRNLREDDSQYFPASDALFGAFEAYRAEVDAAMPRLFRRQPATPLRLEEAENPETAAGAYYQPSDGQPLGRFVVNTRNLKSVPVWGVNTLYLHEAVPGHHYQLAIQFEMKDRLSEYRRKIFSSNAFAEGWALYAERLGRDEGLVKDPLQRFGSLNDEMLRAVRLVVDTGIHHKGWSREQAIGFMAEHLASDRRSIEIEADRYAVMPAQALGYKLGQIRILELREKARQALGERFDIRDFHEVVIGHGMVSLGVLEGLVDAWIAGRKAG